MRKYAACIAVTFKNTQVYRMDLLFKILGSFLLVVAMRETWVAIYGSGAGMSANTGVSLQEMATYAMLSSMLVLLFGQSTLYEIADRVSTGDVVFELQKPWNYQFFYLCKEIGVSLSTLLYNVVPLFTASFLLFRMKLPTLGNFPPFLMSLLFAVAIGFTLNFLIAMLAFSFTEIWGFWFMKNTVIQLCSGSFIPLWLFPEKMQAVLQWLPFQGIYSIPLSIWIGKVSGAEAWGAVGFQAVWTIFLLAAGQSVLATLNRRLVTTGG